MVQGDRYSLPIRIVFRDGQSETLVTDEFISRVRIKLGTITDNYPDGTLTYDAEMQRWMFPLAQEQTLSMGTVLMQIRLVFGNGDVYNSEPIQQEVKRSIIREVEDG